MEKEDELKALEILKKYNVNASIIGEVLEEKARVILQNAYGAKRFLESPKGELYQEFANARIKYSRIFNRTLRRKCLKQ